MKPPSLFPLLNQIIDYAGLFPPANLALEPAIKNFIRYQTWSERWMLSRFIIPAARLDELARLIDAGLAWEGTLVFSVLGAGNVDIFQAGVEEDIRKVIDFRTRFGERVRLDVYETRVPNSLLDDPGRAGVAEVIPILHGAGLFPFFEAPFGPGWESRARHLSHALGASGARVGFKLRTGGVTADAIPSSAQVALALCVCRDTGVPLKCTAGLHHPIRSYREEVGAKMHGFLNVFVAGVLAYGQGVKQGVVESILEEEHPGGFEFSASRVGWRGLGVQSEQVEVIRQEKMMSFGSCSFEEPRDDLVALGFDLIKS
ncbi:MAG: hypothetical protein Fur0022_42330 [Anaerolineales bacterium]